ncbi:adventurous gliding motility protein GltG [Archangium sp.]|uniref:adventurous gliding motility protein GltG n=1 Tax=Archangium sp. TaxID=1872627 RepID=UPI00286D5B82|nr:adventurous gliding motility protein GltG [Archangium sp.]
MPVPLTLKVFKGDTLVTSKDFERDIIKIGRLASAHLCLEDDKVSRIHSVIEVSADGSLSIIDMGSVEGTYVNGKRVNKGQLSFGDEIKVGGTTLRLENPAAVAAVNLTVAAHTAPAPAATTPVPVETSLAAGLAQAASPAPTPAPVAPAPTLAPVAQVAAPVQRAVAAPQPVAAPVEHPPEAEPAPRVRRVARKGKGPVGLGVHFMWGDQRVGEFFLAPGKKQSLTVGSAKGVDFIMGDAKLGGERFEVVRTDGQSFTVLFTGKMKGELTRKGETMDLKAVIESGKATHEGDVYALTLKDDDLLSVDLGGVTLEALFESVPKRAVAPLGESMDFAVVNIFLVMFFLGSLFVIAAANHAAAGEEYADELSGTDSRLAKLIVKAPENQKNKFLEKLNQQKAEKQAEKAAKAKKDENRTQTKEVKQTAQANQPKSDKKAAAKNMAAKIFGGKGGVASLFGGGSGDLKNAMGNMFAAKGGTGGGFGGLGLKGGGGGGGGGGDTIGIGAVGTKGRGGGMGGYGSGVGGLGGKTSVDVGIAADEATVTGSLDKELIRQVIARNRGQIKYCFESLLNRFPKLGGKVAIRFTIASEGNVVTSSVAQSTAGNSELEQCVAGRVRTWAFPKPKGGGSVVVTYPFIFKAAGE